MTNPQLIRETRWLAYGALLAGTAAAVLFNCGCGDSAVVVHAKAARATRDVIVAARDGIREARMSALTDAAHGSDTADQAEARVETLRQRWQPAVDGINAVVEAHDVWVSVLVAAVADEQWDEAHLLQVARDVVVLWDALVRVAADLNFDLPAPPELLLALSR